jgi:replicative DNA helicase
MAGEALQASGPGDVSPLARGEKVPHSVQAEQALLGAIMVNNRTYDALEGGLRPDHFYVPLHAAVFSAIEDIINSRGGEANPITLSERLRGSAFDAGKDLFPHLSRMFETATFAGDAKSLAEVIVTAYRQRQLMGLAESVHKEARAASKPEDVEAMLEAVGSEVFRLADMSGEKRTKRSVREHLIDVIRQVGAAKESGTGITGVTSGFIDIDRLLGGFQNSDLIILGARPSMGKTSLLVNIAQTVAMRHLKGEFNSGPVAMFSLEMSAAQLMQRVLSNASAINAQQLAVGRVTDADMLRLVKAANELHSLPLVIDDTPGLSISAFRARARQMKRQHGIGLIVVDYLQLLTCPLKGDFNRVQEISQISQGLKHVARELDVPVIAASQLSRLVESRDNKRPLLSDLRDSGTIEQDADVVLMLYRAEYYLSRALGAGDEASVASDVERKRIADTQRQLDAVRGITEVIVAKNRKGPTDTVKLLFDGATTTFQNFKAG